MNIGKVSNQNFNGHLDIMGYEYRENKAKKTVLKPTRQLIDANSIKRISEDDENVIISYKDINNNSKDIFLPYSFANKLEYYNLVLNAYNAAKSHPDIAVAVPKSDFVINI